MPNLTPTSYDAFTHSVMRRVYAVYILRRIGKPAILESVLLGVCLFVISCMVSLRNVMTNAEQVKNTSAMLPVLRFFWAAFLNTNSLVKMLCIALCLAAILFCYSVIYPFFKRVLRQSGQLVSQVFLFFRGVRAARAI